MANKLDLTGLSANFANSGVTLTTGATTISLVTALVNAVVQGKFITTTLATTAAAFAPVAAVDGTTVVSVTIPAKSAVIVVHTVNAWGARKDIIGNYVPTDVVGNIAMPLVFPSIPDNLTPIAYSTVRTVTNPFVFGTTLWSATGVILNSATGLAAGNAFTCTNVSVLPSRPLQV